MKRIIYFTRVCVAFFIFSGCAATRTDINGLYSDQQSFTKKRPVKVLFDFFYYTRETGRDAIPKNRSYSGVSDFNDIFKESLKELTNIAEYETFYNTSDLINNLEKRQERERKIAKADYVVKLEFLEENSFSKHVLGIIVTSISLNFIPVAYSWDYTFTATIIKKNEGTVAKYSRNAAVTNWLQNLLLVLYPFHPIEAKTEQVYLESLTNLCRQIENENILR